MPTDQPTSFVSHDLRRLVRQMRELLDEFHREQQVFQQALRLRDTALRHRQTLLDAIRHTEDASVRLWVERASRHTSDRGRPV